MKAAPPPVPSVPTRLLAPSVPTRLLTLNEVAERLRCSYWSARNLVLTRQLACVRLPAPKRRRTFHKGRLAGQTQIIAQGRILVAENDLAKFIEEHRSAGA